MSALLISGSRAWSKGYVGRRGEVLGLGRGKEIEPNRFSLFSFVFYILFSFSNSSFLIHLKFKSCFDFQVSKLVLL
jgi:hypothetical protein